MDKDLVADLANIKFEMDTGSHKKYIATIPKNIWTKWRKDKFRKTVKFGDNRYQQYKDRIGDWSFLDHRDKKRRDRYRARHSKIMKVLTEEYTLPSYEVPFTPEWFSWYLLW